MKIKGLRIHKYAPELNSLVLSNGKTFKASGCKSIGEARRKLFPQYEFIRFIKAEVKSSLDFLSNTYSVMINNGKIKYNDEIDFTIPEFILWVKNRHNEFVDMKGNKVTYDISFKTGSKYSKKEGWNDYRKIT